MPGQMGQGIQGLSSTSFTWSIREYLDSSKPPVIENF